MVQLIYHQVWREGVPLLFDWKEFSGTSIFWFVFVAIDKNEQSPGLENF